MTLEVKLLHPKAKHPVREYPTDSGLDLFACLDEDVIIPPAYEYKLNPPELVTEYLVTQDNVTVHKRIETTSLHTPSKVIPTGISVLIPKPRDLKTLDGGYETLIFEGQLRPRSGWASKGVSCHLGSIDNPYTGELKVIMYNFSNQPVTISHGAKIAQFVVVPIVIPTVKIVEEFSEVRDRGSNGFGSSGY